MGVAETAKQVHGLGGVQGQVFGYDVGGGQHGAQPPSCARLGGGGKTMHIHDGFACHEKGIGHIFY